MRRALLVTPYWPPVNRVGVWRVLRTARYLKDYHWEPVICTPIPEQVYKDIPHLDAHCVAPDIEVIRPSAFVPSMAIARALGAPKRWMSSKKRSKSLSSLHKLTELLDRGSFKIIANLLPPDQFVEWGVQAAQELKGREELQIDVVWVTGGPFGFFVAGVLIAEALGKPLVLDYRDPWTTHREARTWWLSTPQSVLRMIEGWALKRASAVGYIHREALIANRAAFGQKSGARWSVIRNSFDPIDLGNLAPRSLSEEYGAPALVYAGNFYQERSAKGILETLVELDQLDPESREYPLTLHLFGQLDPPAMSVLREHALSESRLKLYPRHSADEIGAIMRGAEALLLVIGEGGGHQVALSGKLWDYLAAGRPILGLGPRVAAAKQLITDHNLGVWVDSCDREALLSTLKQISRDGLAQPSDQDLSGFHARHMSQAVAELLDHAYETV